jgi:hypothetical protein
MIDDVTTLRLRLRECGYDPIPAVGKAPPMTGWSQKLGAAPDEIRLWDSLWSYARNTGTIAKRTPAIDIDIVIEDAAEATEALAREQFEEPRGDTFLVRIGLPPKRLIPLRTDEPFRKLARIFTAPNGSEHKIEILGDGQQWIAAGIHPDTGEPYRWFGGELTATPRDKLPYVRQTDAEKFLADAARLLVEQFGFVEKGATTAALVNVGAPRESGDEPRAAPAEIAAALAVIPNNADWDGWNNIGMACWRATGGAAEGFTAFDAWSSKSPKYDARITAEKWVAYFRSPPTQIGAGTIFYLADQVSPGWRTAQDEPPETPLRGGAYTDYGADDPPDWRRVYTDYGADDLPDWSQQQPQRSDPPPLPYVDLAAELKPREWLVPERIPMRNVSMLGGEGSIGKSLLLMQLSGAVVLGREWIGTLPEPGPVLYMSCEEDDDEVRRRMEDVARHLGSTRQEMIEHDLRFLSFAGKDAILAQPNRVGIMQPKALLDCLCREASTLHPKLIAIDTVADTFGGKENDRAQTRQFITMLRGLAITTGAAVVILAHPSLTGIATDTGLSGNTGWHNSVRARMYLKAAPGDDTALRMLETKKSNYGPVTESILLRWRDGVYVVEPGKGLGAEAEVDHLFLKLLRRFTEQGRNVSENKSSTYAPAVFADEREAKEAKATKRVLAEAMARLFVANKVRAVPFGPPSRMRSRIVEVGQEQPEPASILPFQPPSNRKKGLPTAFQPPSNPASDAFQPPSNGVCSNPPITPHPVGRGKGAFEAPAPSNRNGGSEDERLPSVLRGWAELFGFGSFVTLPLLVNDLMPMDPNDWPDQPGMRAMQSALRAVAESEPRRIDSARLEQWLSENCGIEVGHLTLRDAGEKNGERGWMLTLRVEPDKGSPSL